MMSIKDMELIVNSLFQDTPINNSIEAINYNEETILFLKENKILIRYLQMLENNNVTLNNNIKSVFHKEKEITFEEVLMSIIGLISPIYGS